MLGYNPHQLMTCWGFQVISQPFQQTTLQVQGGEEGRTDRNVPTWTGEALVFVWLMEEQRQEDIIWMLLCGI